MVERPAQGGPHKTMACPTAEIRNKRVISELGAWQGKSHEARYTGR